MSRPTMMETVNYSEMRQKLATHLDQCVKFGKRFEIIRNGKPEGILLSVTEWEQMLTTLDVLMNPKMMAQLAESEKDIRRRRLHTIDDAFRGLTDD